MSAMSLKAELQTWASALSLYDSRNLQSSIAEFEKIADTSKINWNIGIIHATMGKHELAVKRFKKATAMDGFMVVGYYQRGVSNFMMGRYDAAHKDFEDALLYMRGNQTINYDQLGLSFRLYAAEVLFNCGLAKIYMGQTHAGLADLQEAAAQKQLPEHEVIGDAIRDRGRDYNVFSVGILFKPSPGKLKNLESRDYMGKAVLVAATDPGDAYTTFTGITRLQRGQTPTGAPLDAGHPLSRSASVNAIASPEPTRMMRSNTLAVALPSLARSSSCSSTLRQAVAVAVAHPPSYASSNIPTPPHLLSTEIHNNHATTTTAHGAYLPRLHVDIPRSAISPSTFDRRDIPLGSRSPPAENIRTPPQRHGTLRVTELYDDYYTDPQLGEDELAELPPIGEVKTLAVRGAGCVPPGARAPALTRGQSLRGPPPPSSYSPSLGRGGTIRRAPSLARSATSSRASRYDVEEEGGGWMEMVKIRVKVHVGALTRAMSASPLGSFDDFVDSLHAKFPELAAGGLSVRFKDEDGDMLSMQDEGDWEAAVDVARVMAGGRAEGKLEIWVD